MMMLWVSFLLVSLSHTYWYDKYWWSGLVGWLQATLSLSLSLSLPLIRYTLRKENEGLFLFSATNSTMDT